jgi:hypothetical protein
MRFMEFNYLANYSDGGEIPDWGVAPTLCTARGRAIVVRQGRSLAAEFRSNTGGDVTNLKVVHDAAAQRDATTAADLLTGLGLNISSIGDAALFDPQKAKICAAPTDADYAEGVREQLEKVAPPADLHAVLVQLQAILGKGVGPSLPAFNMSMAHGYWVGGGFVAYEWLEAMLLQLGAGLPVGYGRVDTPTLYKMMHLIGYYRAITARNVGLVRRSMANLLARASADLAAANPRTVRVYVGHDTQLDGIAALLNLSWLAPPYPAGSTPPGSIIRITKDDSGIVRAAFLSTAFEDSATAGDVHTVPATFAGAVSMPLDDFRSRINATIDHHCVGAGGGETVPLMQAPAAPRGPSVEEHEQ